MISLSRRNILAAVFAVLALIVGSAAALHYASLDLTLSHYDARGHLIVARRVLDSITPGWRQIGAVWLPLPHLLNAIPVQLDAFYRTGASAVLLSIVSYALAVAAIAWVIHTITRSRTAALVGASALALNPNVLYLQATPMTEPLLLGLTAAAIALTLDTCRRRALDASSTPRLDHAAGILWALACLTRYEAWPIAAASLACVAWTNWRSSTPVSAAFDQIKRIGIYPTLAVLSFFAFSRVVGGEWFVSDGFFVPDNPAQGHPLVAAGAITWGVRQLSGTWLVAVAYVGLTAMVVEAIRRRDRVWTLVPVALGASTALPFSAFLSGHPYRIRYMVPLMAIEAVGIGLAAGLGPRLRLVRAAAVALVLAAEIRPFDAHAPMIVEAQWDRPNAMLRRHVTECLRERGSGDVVMASMGSLGHYMQELSREGFAVRDFLHEGNGDIWLHALKGPRRFVPWLMIEESAEGGDMLAAIARDDPAFLEGFTRVCEGGGVALYRRNAPEGTDDANSGLGQAAGARTGS